MSKYMVITFDKIIRTTALAHLIRFDTEEVWIPNSQIGHIDEDENEMLISEWFVLDKGLEAYEA